MTEDVSDVPKELLESVRDVIGRKIKIFLKKKVKLEMKGDKVENKVLVDVEPLLCFRNILVVRKGRNLRRKLL